MLLGTTHSQATIDKMRLAKIGKCLTEEHRKKIGKSLTGRLCSEKTREKISLALTGIPFTEERKRKIRLGQYPHGKPFGELNPSWRGGTSNEPYPLNFNRQLKETIRIRDNRTCQLCSMPEEEYFRALDIHHINYDKKDISPMNLISLCVACNSKANAERAYHQILFSEKIKEIYRCLYGL